MGEYASRGPAHSSSSYATSTSYAASVKPPSLAEVAHSAVVTVKARLAATDRWISELEVAGVANDRPRWDAARTQAANALASAEHAISNVREADADERDTEGLASARHALAERTTQLNEVAPPRGYVLIACEEELRLSVERLAAAPEGDRVAREAVVRGWTEALTLPDAKALQQRLVRRAPYDELVAAITALPLAERSRVVLFHHETERRKARELVAPRPALEVPRSESLDDRLAGVLARVLDTGDARAFVEVASTMSLDQREMLARRLIDYRQGSGDSVAARFVRLERPVREGLLAMLHTHHVVAPTEHDEDDRVASTYSPLVLHQPGTAQHYLQIHRPAILSTFRSRLEAELLCTGHPHLRWSDPASFRSAVIAALEVPEPGAWAALLHPQDPWHVIDSVRSGQALEWVPMLGLALASELSLSLHRSLARTSARYVIEAGTGGQVAAEVLIASHPMDRISIAGLCAPHAVAVEPRASSGASTDVQARGLRLVNVMTWCGSSDPSLWNWVRIDEPSDASPEEVAVTLWQQTDYAYGLVDARPYYGIPASWARQLPAMRALEPELGAEGSESAMETIAGTDSADAVALAQCKHPSLADRATSLDALAGSSTLLHELYRMLGRVALTDELSLASQFVSTKRTWATTATRDQLLTWSMVFAAQHEILVSVCELVALVYGASYFENAALRDDRAHPAIRLLDQLRRTAATSMFERSARAELVDARAQVSMLHVHAGAYESARIDRGLAGLRAGEAADPFTARGRAATLDAERGALQQTDAALQDQALAGGKPDPEALEIARVTRRWLELRIAIATVQHQLGELNRALAQADEGWIATAVNIFATELVVLPVRIGSIIRELDTIDAVLDSAGSSAIERQLEHVPDATKDFARSALLRETRAGKVQNAGERFVKLARSTFLASIRGDAIDAIHDAHIRLIVANIAIQVGIAVASAGIASVASEVVAGAVTTAGGVRTFEGAYAVGRTAKAAAAVTSFVVDSAANATGQALLQGGSFGATFAENLLTNAAVLAVLKPLQVLARRWSGIDATAFAMWEREGATWKLAATKTAALTGEAITAAAVGYATHRAIAAAKGEHLDDVTLAEWAAQGATIVIGHAVQSRLGASMERLKLAGREAGDLIARTQQQLVLAAKLEHAPDREHACELLESELSLREEEASFWRSLRDDPSRLAVMGTTSEQVDVRSRGLAADGAVLRDWSFVEVQLRLSGLEQEYAGAKLWVGDSEQIAAALAHAARMHIEVVVEHRDVAARSWTVSLGGAQIAIRERARTGRTRDANGDVTTARVAHAKRYAESARTLRPVLEKYVRGVVEADPDFATGVIHIGDGFGGIMHRDTRFEQGLAGDPHSQLVLFTHDGAMTNRGALPSGQNPDAQTMPGVRTREHTTDHTSYTPSSALGDATMVGRFESQTPAYRAEAIKLEHRAAASFDPWRHADKAWRMRVKSEHGERWIYSDSYENAGGMGPTNWRPLEAITDGDLAALRAKGLVLAGDDPDLSTKLGHGERVLVWGGSPTGAWASQDVAMHRSSADLMGESPAVRRGPDTQPGVVTAEEFATRLRGAIESGDVAAIDELRTQRINETHSGSQVPRNTIAGAAYGRGAAAKGIHVELGVPTRMVVEGDKLRVTIGVGEHASNRTYDRVILALGQDPGLPGGPAGLLGRGAARSADGTLNMTEPVPAGTVALHMVLNGDRLTGLESEDGTVRLVGAAYASPKLAAWVVPSDRARFFEKVNALARTADATHTGARISADSHGVLTGIEIQRDRVPLANEVVGARDYRLPAELSADRLSLPAHEIAEWPAHLEQLFTVTLRARPGRVEVYPDAVREGMHAFRVYNGGEEVGVVRVYKDAAQAAREAEAAGKVLAAVPSLKEANERGVSEIEGGGALSLASHARTAAGARPATFGQLVDAWVGADSAGRKAARMRIDAAVVRTAQTLAEIHELDGSSSLLPDTEKAQQVAAVLRGAGSPTITSSFESDATNRLMSRLQVIAERFRVAKVPVTRGLADPRAKAFSYDDLKTVDQLPSYGRLTIEDLGGLAARAGGRDVAGFLDSLRSDPRLAGNQAKLEKLFMDTYQAANGDNKDIKAVVDWYRAASIVDRANTGTPDALRQLREFASVQP